MKKIVAAALLSSLAAFPALAKTMPAANGYGLRSTTIDAMRGVRAQAAPSALGAEFTDVYVNGEYVGTDPDPNIRASLRRDYRSWDHY